MAVEVSRELYEDFVYTAAVMDFLEQEITTGMEFIEAGGLDEGQREKCQNVVDFMTVRFGTALKVYNELKARIETETGVPFNDIADKPDEG